jgi:hypothetical protein
MPHPASICFVKKFLQLKAFEIDELYGPLSFAPPYKIYESVCQAKNVHRMEDCHTYSASLT